VLGKGINGFAAAAFRTEIGDASAQ